jgi:hypothetical protein
MGKIVYPTETGTLTPSSTFTMSTALPRLGEKETYTEIKIHKETATENINDDNAGTK